jgi:hypothetical protein
MTIRVLPQNGAGKTRGQQHARSKISVGKAASGAKGAADGAGYLNHFLI